MKSFRVAFFAIFSFKTRGGNCFEITFQKLNILLVLQIFGSARGDNTLRDAEKSLGDL